MKQSAVRREVSGSSDEIKRVAIGADGVRYLQALTGGTGTIFCSPQGEAVGVFLSVSDFEIMYAVMQLVGDAKGFQLFLERRKAALEGSGFESISFMEIFESERAYA